MVFNKRPGPGSCGRQDRVTRRVPILSPGKRSTRRKKNETYGLDLLATVAGTLLADEENLSSRADINGTTASYTTIGKSVKAGQFDNVPALNNIALRKVSFEGCTEGCADACAFLRQNNISLTENSWSKNVADIVLEPPTEKTGAFDKGSSVPEYETIGVRRSRSPRSDGNKQVHQDEPNTATLHSSIDTMHLDASPSVVSSDGSSGVHLEGHNSSPMCHVEVQPAEDIDDVENSSGCMHPDISGKGGYLSHYIGECRTDKLADSFRKDTHNKIRGEMSNKGSKLNLCGNKMSTTHRSVQLQRGMFKTRRLAEFYSAQPSDEGILSETIKTPFHMGDQDPPCASEGYHVNLSIKSFKFPELAMEIPENATIGLLKKIVMDAVTTTIERNLRVGVHLEGNVIQDDDKTLHQAGIRHGSKPNNIELTLECEVEQDSHLSVIDLEEADSIGTSVVEPVSMINFEEPLPQNVVKLNLVPLPESNQSVIGQRRKRNPFSITEVEALVGAVEQFGTKRWKEVQSSGFVNSGHRTKVDLKDKWKNIVKTASIPPQLRRGNTVPQELLDRVLAAQAYWSLRQQEQPPEP